MSVDLCYVISHGFAARMILHSDILSALQKRGISVGLVVPNADEPSMQALARKRSVQLAQAPQLKSRLLNEYESLLRRYLFEDVLDNPSLRSWHHRYLDTGGKTGLKARTYLQLNRLSLRFPAIRRTLDRMERRLFLRNAAVGKVLEEMNPKVVVSTYPVAILEACFLHAARTLHRPTVSQLLSWDNITSKGRFSVTADHFITWGPIMTEEVQEYYNVSTERIHECGVAHFDRHVTLPSPEGAAAVISELELDPEKPFLFFGMSSPAITLYEIEVVEWLAQTVRENRWGPDVQLVVRPHPQNVRGYTADTSWLPRLNALAGNRVAIDYPSLEKSSLAWNMKETDLPRLVNLIAGCTICLNSGSTLSIDAVIQDKPVILTVFDGTQTLPWHRSIRRYRDVIHMNKLIALGGVHPTGSFEELEQAIAAYLANPDLDAEARAHTRTQECGPCDGQASERIADALVRIVQAAQASASSQPMLAAVHE